MFAPAIIYKHAKFYINEKNKCTHYRSLLFLWPDGSDFGVINFTETIKLHMEMPGQDPEMMKKIPQTHSVQKVLYFQGGESLYKNNLGNQDLEVNNNDQHGGEIRMVMKSPENTLYADVKIMS